MAEKVYEFDVEMTCGGCSGTVEKVLSKEKGKSLADFKIDLEAKKVFVTSSSDSQKILETIQKTGKKTVFVGEKI